jgi:hypothetical protein
MPAVTPEWSPVAHFGGYQAAQSQGRSGVRQAELLGEAAAESGLHRQWRVRRGLVPETDSPVLDPCFF